MRSAPPGAFPLTARLTHPSGGLSRRRWRLSRSSARFSARFSARSIARSSARSIVLPLALLLALVAAGCGSTHITVVTVPTATHLSVTLTTDFASYSVSQAIGVTVTNAGKRALYAVDNHTQCTILQLQEQVRGAWTDIMPCNTGQPVNVLEVAPGSGVPYTLAPGNAHGNPNAWDPGVYRVALLLGTKADGSNLTTSVYSAGFVIKAA